MSDLDSRIRGVLNWYFNVANPDIGLRVSESNQAIERIKQAFIDAGWRQGQGPYQDAMLDAIKKEAGLMTGQEWYDRFQDELKGRVFPHGDTNRYVANAVNEMLDAAKKAAGIE